MKEIIYIQAGTLANFAGTHFWNTEDSYASLDDYEDLVDHDVSFRQCLSYDKETFYAPRALMIDNKSNIGRVTDVNSPPNAKSETGTLWTGEVEVSEQDPIPKSEYFDDLEQLADDEEAKAKGVPESIASKRNMRYWTDFTHVLYAPQTIHSVPDIERWDRSRGDWFAGKDQFTHYEEDESLMEGSFRRLVEETDGLQGLQIMYDTAPFGSFIDSLLVSFRDEYSKNSVLTFPFLSVRHPSHLDLENPHTRSILLNDALCLRNLDELGQLNVPIQAPQTWTKGAWCDGLDLDFELVRPHHVSAILSTHIESSTLPLRLRGASTNFASLARHLNQPGNTRFSRLLGILPVASSPPSNSNTDSIVYDFSTLAERPIFTASSGFSRVDITRSSAGLKASTLDSPKWYSAWKEAAFLKEPLLANVHLPPQPLPTSFPSLLRTTDASPVLSSTTSQPLRSTSSLSSLSSGSQIAHLFSFYAKSVGECIKRRMDVTTTMGLDGDEVKELENDLWTLHDNVAEDGMRFTDDGEDTFGDDD